MKELDFDYLYKKYAHLLPSKDRDIYLHYNSNFTKLTYNNFENEKILMSKVKCLL